MPEELRVDAMELCVTACEKFSSNNEVKLHFIFEHNSLHIGPLRLQNAAF